MYIYTKVMSYSYTNMYNSSSYIYYITRKRNTVILK